MSEIVKEGRKKCILLVDDNEQMRTVLRKILVLLGKYDVDEATSGIDAVRVVEERDAVAPDMPYDAVVTDYNMPGMNGGDLVRFLRVCGYWMPIVMLTGDVDESLNDIAGISALLRKPVDADQLLAAVNGLFDQPEQPVQLED